MRASQSAPIIAACLLGALPACVEPPPRGTESARPVATGAVLVGAGDIGHCFTAGDEITAALLDNIPGTVFTVGDNVYPDGTTTDFQKCYDPSWGRHKARTRPSPGNHDYHTPGAAGYFSYFGSNAGPEGRGYYSYNLGGWHIISLNSNIAADSGSAQMQWLREDLAANRTNCALAYWHNPVFSSGKHGSHPRMAAAWEVLDVAGVDVVVNGHDHNYERFAPQTSTGAAAPNGVRQFVVGTGGSWLVRLGTVKPNSEVRNSTTFGVLKLTLNTTSYDWVFATRPGATFRDSGTAPCVDLSVGD